jgi:hypothetical protein
LEWSSTIICANFLMSGLAGFLDRELAALDLRDVGLRDVLEQCGVGPFQLPRGHAAEPQSSEKMTVAVAVRRRVDRFIQGSR